MADVVSETAAAATNDADAFEQLAAWVAAESGRRASIELGSPIAPPVGIKISGWHAKEATQQHESAQCMYQLHAHACSFGRAWDLLSEQLRRVRTE